VPDSNLVRETNLLRDPRLAQPSRYASKFGGLTNSPRTQVPEQGLQIEPKWTGETDDASGPPREGHFIKFGIQTEFFNADSGET
jgi:hypothetical protein